MSEAFGNFPWVIDAGGVSLARRPRLYWTEWELHPSCGAIFGTSEQQVQLVAKVHPEEFLTPGWKLNGHPPLPTFTTSRPQSKPGYKPAGLNSCSWEERQRRAA